MRERNTRTFWATRDGLALRFMDEYWAGKDYGGAASFQLSRTEPPWVVPAEVFGGLLGALLGWLLTAWVSRRTERRRAATIFTAAAAGFGLFLLLPTLVFTGAGLVLGGGTTAQGQPDQPIWTIMTLILLQGLQKTAAVLGLAVLIVAAWPRPRRPLPDGPSRPVRVSAVPIVV